MPADAGQQSLMKVCTTAETGKAGEGYVLKKSRVTDQQTVPTFWGCNTAYAGCLVEL